MGVEGVLYFLIPLHKFLCYFGLDFDAHQIQWWASEETDAKSNNWMHKK